MSGATETGGTVGIVELVAICAEMRGRCRAMFRAIGQWVPQESDPVAQRRYAIASHRHAWHADLWDERLPKIPVDAIGVDSVTILPPDRWYPAALDEMIADLDELEARVDPMLDPSTVRVITLVRADLVDLRST
ncbi:MAG: hypothetical protein KDB37_07130 [Ilumatobacter sp.]|nr:hypothetical protein [Ilumatobacter sp.]